MFGLAERLQEHEAGDLIGLNVESLHLLDGIREGHSARLEHIQGQFNILQHLCSFKIVLKAHQLYHLALVFCVAGDLAYKMAQGYSIPEVCPV